MYRISIVLVLVITMFCSTSYSNEDIKKIHPFVILEGVNSQITEPCYLRTTTLHEWLWVWLQHKPSVFDVDKNQDQSHRTAWTYNLEELTTPEIPRVDFSQQMVVAIFLGNISKISGFETEILETEESIEFTYSTVKDIESESDARGFYGFWVLPRIDKSLVIKEKDSDQTYNEKVRLGRFQEYDKLKSFYKPKVLDLKEFLFKSQLETFLKVEIESRNNPSSQDSVYRRPIYFIDMDSKEDPSDEFLERFSGFGPMIKKYSDSTGYDMSGVKDIKTKKDGVIIFARFLRWIDKNNAEAEYGYYMHGVGAMHTTVTVEYKDGKWIIKDILEHSVS